MKCFMRNRILYTIVLMFISLHAWHAGAQHNTIYRWKAVAKYGSEMHVGEANGAGAELGFELPQYGKKNWHFSYNFPTIGFALGYVNMLGTDSVSRPAYTFPYFLWPIVNTPQFAMNLKLGAGFGAYLDYGTHSHAYNFPFFGATEVGLNFDVRLGRKYGNPLTNWQLTFGGNCMFLHDGNTDRRQTYYIFPNGNIGLRHTANYYPLPMKHPARKKRKVLALETSIQGGGNQLDWNDGDKYYPNASLNVGFYWPFSNVYRMGLGAECFYNSIYDGKQRTDNRRYNFIDEDKFVNKIRAGIFWANEITIERFAAGIHIGGYAFNPIKVPDQDDLGRDNGNLTENFLYWKFVTKYRFTKHVYVTTQLKSHMNKVEDFEMGLGFTMPDFGARVKNPFARISFKKDDPNELRIEDETYTKRPFRHREAFDE